MAVKSVMRALLLLFSFLPVAVLAVTPANKNASQATLNLYKYIAALPDKSTKRVISGQEAGNANPSYNIYSAAQGYPLYVTNLKNATGTLVGLAGFDYSSDPTPSYKFPQITDTGVLEIVNTTIISHWKQGGIVTVMFGANNPWTGGAGNDTNRNGRAITDAITPGTAAYSNWIAQLDAVATALKQLQDAGVVVLWRPLHEMNGNWFWWGAASNPQDYKDLWQHMFNYFTNTKKLNNLIWVYSASSGVSSAQNSVNTYYPGANYVDIVALDGYKDTIDTAIVAAYNSLLQNGKPFALAEYGPASPPSGTLSTSGNFDFSTLITGIRNNLPKTCYFMAWADCPTCNPKVHWSMVSNLNAKALLSDAWVINASDLAIDLQNLSLAAPGAPTVVSATAGNTQATVSFAAPTNTGGSAITGYTVTSNPGVIIATGSVSPITVTGLINGTAYTFTVSATNAVGTSALSAASNAVTPSAPTTTTSTCILAASPTSIPAGSTSTLTASCSPAATSYTWSANTGFASTVAIGTVSPSVTTIYTVAGSNAGGTGNTATATVMVTAIVPSIPPSCFLTVASTPISAGGSSTLTVTCTPAATSYIWTGGTCAGTSAASCSVTPSITTIYSVTGINAFGSSSQSSATVTVSQVAAPYTGLWYNPNESGWGMSVTQHGNTLFAVPYTYDATGQPTWYVMSSCPMVTAGSCSGDLYKVSGGTSPAVPWNGTGKVVGSAGSGTLSFDDANHGRFAYNLNGVAGSKTIERQLFSNGTPQFGVDYSDLWWNANESGWGIALTQDHGIIFAAWYAYDASGKAIWLVASNCPLASGAAGNGCTGDLYQVSGGSPLTTTWNGANKVVTKTGSVTFTFTDANNANMTYTLNGVAGTRVITRQGF